MTSHRAQQRHAKWYIAGALAALVAAGVIVAALLGVFGSANEAAPASQPTAEVALEPTQTAEPRPDVDIATTRSMPYTPVWNPPDGGQDFWQIVDPENGYPETGGTDYILAHACLDRDCVGNQIRSLESGDELTYRGEPYVVQDKLEIHKTEIGEQDIWRHDADRLVVITCIIDPETGIAAENDIIIATRG